MTTYRERREQRAERLDEWADKRDAKAAASFAAVDRIADGIPFGQPILVGHHSERHARRDQERMESGMRAGVENTVAAGGMRSRADEIRHQLDTSIYLDDPDAVERLEEKIAGLEARRDEMKAKNAAYRSEHKTALKTMTPYERSQAVPFPSYSLQNLGGNITRCRHRLEGLKRDRATVAGGGRGVGRPMASRYGGTCPDCGQPFERGASIIWYRASREAVHAVCPSDEKED